MTSNLRRLMRIIWLLMGGGAVLFLASIVLLVVTHPNTPANALVNARTVWIFIPSVAMAGTGVYLSVRYWRCPYCGCSLKTQYPIARHCPRCRRDIGLHED